MKTPQLEVEKETTPEMLCISNIPHTVENVQHDIYVIDQPSSHTFRVVFPKFKILV
jgi:hypothetical protein